MTEQTRAPNPPTGFLIWTGWESALPDFAPVTIGTYYKSVLRADGQLEVFLVDESAEGLRKDVEALRVIVQQLEADLEHVEYHGGSWQERCLDPDCPHRKGPPPFPVSPVRYPGKVG